MRKITLKAVARFGAEAQMDQAVEEAGEFVAARNHFRRGREGAKEELLGEIADLEIMMDQMRVVFGDETVDRVKTAKLKSLEKRLEETGT